MLHAKKAGSRKGIRGKTQLKTAVGDKNDLKNCTDVGTGAIFILLCTTGALGIFFT